MSGLLPQLPRDWTLAILGTLFLLGVAATAERVLRARRHGYSVRLQIFVPLAATTLALSAAFAFIVVDRTQARAAVFAARAADDEAHVLAALLGSARRGGGQLEEAARELERTGVLQAFSRGVVDTRVEVLDEAGRALIDVGSVPEGGLLPARVGPTVVEARVALAGGGAVRVRKGTFGVAQLLSDVALKVGVLALLFAVASALVAYLLGGAVASPIERLTRAALRVAAGERQAALPEPRGREVRLLTRALESMRRELEQRHQLETFVADLSHELKNPIASIRASAEVLELGAADDPVTARRFAGRIGESAAKLGALTQDLLALVRLEARGTEKPASRVDLAQLAREAVEACAAQAAVKPVSLRVNGPESAPVRGDAVWLRRALENLIANAVHYTPAGAEVRVELTSGLAGTEVRVSDRGPGVDPAVQARLFERFVTTRHGDGGTGLGLAIVRAVAELHGGRALLHKSDAQGAVFALWLPRA